MYRVPNFVIDTFYYEGYYVEIACINNMTYEAWLFNPSFGIKSLMFGCDFDQVEDEFDFFDIVEANLVEQIEIYKDNFESEVN